MLVSVAADGNLRRTGDTGPATQWNSPATNAPPSLALPAGGRKHGAIRMPGHPGYRLDRMVPTLEVLDRHPVGAVADDRADLIDGAARVAQDRGYRAACATVCQGCCGQAPSIDAAPPSPIGLPLLFLTITPDTGPSTRTRSSSIRRSGCMGITRSWFVLRWRARTKSPIICDQLMLATSPGLWPVHRAMTISVRIAPWHRPPLPRRRRCRWRWRWCGRPDR